MNETVMHFIILFSEIFARRFSVSENIISTFLKFINFTLLSLFLSNQCVKRLHQHPGL